MRLNISIDIIYFASNDIVKCERAHRLNLDIFLMNDISREVYNNNNGIMSIMSAFDGFSILVWLAGCDTPVLCLNG